MVESHILLYLEERGQEAGGAAQAGEDVYAGGTTLMDHENKVDSEGVIFDCW